MLFIINLDKKYLINIYESPQLSYYYRNRDRILKIKIINTRSSKYFKKYNEDNKDKNVEKSSKHQTTHRVTRQQPEQLASHKSWRCALGGPNGTEVAGAAVAEDVAGSEQQGPQKAGRSRSRSTHTAGPSNRVWSNGAGTHSLTTPSAPTSANINHEIILQSCIQTSVCGSS